MKLSWTDRFFTWFSNGFVFIFALICLIPFCLMAAGSFTQESDLIWGGYKLIPDHLSVEAYRILLQSSVLLKSYGITVFITAVGTALGLMFSSLLAFSISYRNNRWKGFIAMYVYFTMLFSGGMVPLYILVSKWLHLSNTLWALILPLAVQPFLIFLMVSFFKTLPPELEDAAKIDGANELRYFVQIVVPISKPILATVGLFYALTYWNDWFMGLLFISDDSKFPLQLILRRMVSNIEAAKRLIPSGANISVQAPSLQIRMATTILTIGPIIFFYPFIQKYFVKGLTIGAVKG